MSNEIAKPETFEEKMKERIRESIGELMTDEDLSKIVHRAVDEIFFQKKAVNDGWKTVYKDPLIHEILKDVLTNQVKESVENYIKTHNDEINKIVNRVVEDGIGFTFLKALNNKFSSELINFQMQIENKINQV